MEIPTANSYVVRLLKLANPVATGCMRCSIVETNGCVTLVQRQRLYNEKKSYLYYL